MSSAAASDSFSPHQASSGSVKTTAGTASGWKAVGSSQIASIATAASWLALCASIGSPATSPIANRFGSAVRRCRSVSMKPRSSSCAPVCSSPSPALLGRRPVATSTRL